MFKPHRYVFVKCHCLFQLFNKYRRMIAVMGKNQFPKT